MKKILLAGLMTAAAGLTGCGVDTNETLKIVDVSDSIVKKEPIFSNIELVDVDHIRKNSLSGCSDESLMQDCLSLIEINKLKSFSKKVLSLSNATVYEKHLSYNNVDDNDVYRTDIIDQHKESFKNDEILVSELKDYIDYLKSIYFLNNKFNSAIKNVSKEEKSKMINLLSLDKEKLIESEDKFKKILNLIKTAPSSETEEQTKIREKNNYLVKQSIKAVLDLRIDKAKKEVTDAISIIESK